jgi:hypothetical protein
MADKIKNYGITGTAANIQLGKGGPIISGANANVIVLTDSSSNATTVITAEGTENSHAVTLSQLDTITADKLKYETFTVEYDGGTYNLANATANTRIVSVVVEAGAAWSNANSNTTITVGDAADADRLFTAFDPEVQNKDDPNHLYSSETTVTAVVTAGGATAGNATVTVWYTGELTEATSAAPTDLQRMLNLNPSLLLWRDESAGTVAANGSGATATNGDPVGRILDLSGNNNHAVAAGDANRATLTATGWSFDGTNDYYVLTTGIAVANSMTIVRGFTRPSSAIRSLGLGNADNYYPRDAIFWQDNNIYLALATDGTQPNAGSPNFTTGNCVLTSIRSAGILTARLNKLQVINGAGGANSGTAMSLIGKQGGAGPQPSTQGEISFLAVFPGILSADDLDFVESIAQRIP